MPPNRQLAIASAETQIAAFFRASAGKWHSQRRYYMLPSGETQEMDTDLVVRFLEPGCDPLRHLEQLHGFAPGEMLACGAYVSWQSRNTRSGKPQAENSTLFGALGNLLYRDRGFALDRPITAQYYFQNPQTLCLRTEYNSSVFEEELKLIGENYRTRQTIISRAGEQVTIGQYLEKRL